MTNFTKDYIELAKDKRIQGLRAEWQMGDFMYYSDGTIDVMHPKLDNGTPIWLPRGDDLDREICKICDNYWSYKTEHFLTWYTSVSKHTCYSEEIIYITNNVNPLIAKIKLLLQLLECEK